MSTFMRFTFSCAVMFTAAAIVHAQGTPSIAYASAGGVTESIRDRETGRLVEDLDEMVAVTRELLTSSDERHALGASARRLAAGLTWEACAERAEEVLRSSTGARGDQSP